MTRRRKPRDTLAQVRQEIADLSTRVAKLELRLLGAGVAGITIVEALKAAIEYFVSHQGKS